MTYCWDSLILNLTIVCCYLMWMNLVIMYDIYRAFVNVYSVINSPTLQVLFQSPFVVFCFWWIRVYLYSRSPPILYHNRVWLKDDGPMGRTYSSRYPLLTVCISKFITVMSKNVKTSCAMQTVYSHQKLDKMTKISTLKESMQNTLGRLSVLTPNAVICVHLCFLVKFSF